MKTTTENKRYTICLDKRIDGSNAAEVEKEIFALAENRGENDLFIDADGLEYISSAGLRVLMKLCKSVKTKLPIVNVSPEVYDIFETTGFTEILDVRKKLREIDVTGCPVIGQGGNGTIYRLDDDTIVKVYKPWMSVDEIERERKYARTAFINGIPSVIAYDTVKCGDCLGVVFEMLKSDTLGHAMMNNPELLDDYVDKYVELAKKLHSTHIKDGGFDCIQDVYHGYADNLKEWCSDEEIALCHSIIDEIPEVDTVTHNDLHPGNIMIQNDELLLIDMPAVTMGPPVCDMVSIYRDMIVAPAGAEAASIERSTGMSKEMVIKVGNMFFQRYTGITDPEQLKAYYDKIGLLYAFNVALMPGAGSEKAMKLAPILIDKLLRKIVIPNEKAIRQLFKVM